LIFFGYPAPTSLILNRAELNLRTGETFNLYANKVPEKSSGRVSWSSSNNSIATVNSDGIVQAISSGTTTITASVGNIYATCTVNVSSEILPLEITPALSSEGWGQVLTYNISVKNVSGTDISNWSFSFSIPTDSIITIWAPYGIVTAESNTFYGTSLANETTVNISCQIEFPVAANKSLYLSPTVYDITIN
jgi:hypothetical protein